MFGRDYPIQGTAATSARLHGRPPPDRASFIPETPGGTAGT